MGRVQVTVTHARRLAETTAKNSLARLATLSVFLYCSLDFSVTESVKYQTHVDYVYSAQKNLGNGWCVYNFILYALVCRVAAVKYADNRMLGWRPFKDGVVCKLGLNDSTMSSVLHQFRSSLALQFPSVWLVKTATFPPSSQGPTCGNHTRRSTTRCCKQALRCRSWECSQ